MDLFNTKTRNVNDNIYRNITSSQIDVFSELAQGDPVLNQVAIHTEMEAKSELPPGLISRAFHYSIAYPFEENNWHGSRYTNGSFGVWYGSLEKETTIYESAYHFIQGENSVEGLDEVILRHRAVYQVTCQAILIDIVGKEKKYPELISDDYNFTQSIGKRLSFEGHPGLLSPSARCSGTNVNIFNIDVLKKQSLKLIYFLSYRYDPFNQSVQVERQKETLMSLSQGDFTRNPN